MAQTRTCQICGATVPTGEFCPACTQRIPALPDPATMTMGARVAEFDSYDGPLEVPFPLLHARLERLVGRPVFTHEFAAWDRLRVEVLSGEHPTFEQTVGKFEEINPDLTVIVVSPEE